MYPDEIDDEEWMTDGEEFEIWDMLCLKCGKVKEEDLADLKSWQVMFGFGDRLCDCMYNTDSE